MSLTARLARARILAILRRPDAGAVCVGLGGALTRSGVVDQRVADLLGADR